MRIELKILYSLKEAIEKKGYMAKVYEGYCHLKPYTAEAAAGARRTYDFTDPQSIERLLEQF